MSRLLTLLLLISCYTLHAQQPQVKALVEAESLLSRQDTAAAVEIFQETLNRYPDSYAAALRLTELHYLQGDFRQAIQYSFVTEDILTRFIDSVRTREPVTDNDIARARRYARDLADLHMLKGKIRLKQNRPVDALHDLNQALEASDRKSDVMIDIGLAHISLGEYDEANAAFKASLETEPDNKGALFNLGNLFYALKEYDSARHYYQRTQTLYPELKWPLLYLGNIATGQQEYDSAIHYYTRFIALDTTTAEAYFRRAVLYSETRRWENAISDWDQVLAIDDGDAEAWRNRGLAWFQLEKYEQALADFNRSIDLDPEAYTYINRGYTHYLLKNYDNALADLNTGLATLPEYGLGYYLRALTQLKQKDQDAACQDLQRALENGFSQDDVRDKKLRKRCL